MARNLLILLFVGVLSACGGSSGGNSTTGDDVGGPSVPDNGDDNENPATGSVSLTTGDFAQLITDVGGYLALEIPSAFSLDAEGSAVSLRHLLPRTLIVSGTQVVIQGYAPLATGQWERSIEPGVVSRLSFFTADGQLVPTSADIASFASVAQVAYQMSMTQAPMGQRDHEVTLTLSSPHYPWFIDQPDFPAVVDYEADAAGRIEGDFGEIAVHQVRFSQREDGVVVGEGEYQLSGELVRNDAPFLFNSSAAFGSGGMLTATVRAGLNLGTGLELGSAMVAEVGLQYSEDGQGIALDVAGVAGSAAPICTLDNINFDNYSAMFSAESLAQASATIGCAYRIVYLSAEGAMDVRWYLDGHPGVYVEANFYDGGGVGGSIVGINSETGVPYCGNAPEWPDCIGR